MRGFGLLPLRQLDYPRSRRQEQRGEFETRGLWILIKRRLAAAGWKLSVGTAPNGHFVFASRQGRDSQLDVLSTTTTPESLQEICEHVVGTLVARARGSH